VGTLISLSLPDLCLGEKTVCALFFGPFCCKLDYPPHDEYVPHHLSWFSASSLFLIPFGSTCSGILFFSSSMLSSAPLWCFLLPPPSWMSFYAEPPFFNSERRRVHDLLSRCLSFTLRNSLTSVPDQEPQCISSLSFGDAC